MSNTRRAKPGEPLRQERFASSPEFGRGLLANLVAARCSLLQSAEDRDLVWFVQYLSHQPGALKALADYLLQRYPGKVGTVSMLKWGMRPGQKHNADQIHAVESELSEDKAYAHTRIGRLLRDSDYSCRPPRADPASEWLEVCQRGALSLEMDLARLCLDPEVAVEDGWPWYFPELLKCLREHRATWIRALHDQTVVTEIGLTIYEGLDYALNGKCMVLVDGLSGTGKSFAVKAWCAERPGQARYVEVPSTSDDIGFYRAIAKALGVSINLNSKAHELRQRIEETLQCGDLTIVFDEAHYLWPASSYRDALPGRINWIMTALVNKRVPVVLVTTPQFMASQKKIERRSSWTSEQFIGRIGHYEKLPCSLSKSDLAKVAAVQLPEGDTRSIELLACYAEASAKYLRAIESAVRRARYLAGRAGREVPTSADVKRAIKESVIPSDKALAHALAEPEKRGGRQHQRAVKEPLMAVTAPSLAGPEDARDHNNFTGNRATLPPVRRDLVPV